MVTICICHRKEKSISETELLSERGSTEWHPSVGSEGYRTLLCGVQYFMVVQNRHQDHHQKKKNNAILKFYSKTQQQPKERIAGGKLDYIKNLQSGYSSKR